MIVLEYLKPKMSLRNISGISLSRYSVYGRDNLQYFKGVIIRSSKELEHHDVNIISKNRYMKSMRKGVFQIMEVSS